MIGYLILSEGTKQLADEGMRILERMVTFRYFKTFNSERSTLILFRNEFPNSHFFEDDYVAFAATGTVIYSEDMGVTALKRIHEDLDAGKSLEELFKELGGPFNLVWFDKKAGTISLLTDREGLQPGYVYEEKEGGKTAHSSNLLLLASLMKVEPDFESIRDFIHIGATVEGRTLFQSIRRLDSANLYREDGEGWEKRRLWKIGIGETNDKRPFKETVEELAGKILNCLSFLKKIDGKRICTDLSGGTDSRTILSFLLKMKGKVDVCVGGPEDHEDVVIHREIARKLELHSLWYPDPTEKFKVTHERLIEAVEIADGTRNPITLMPALPFFKKRGQDYDILLGGNGGPLFKDHYWLFEFNRVNRRTEPNWKRIAHLSTIDYPWQDGIFKENGKEGDRLAEIYLKHSQKVNGTNNQKLDFVYFDLKMKAYHAPQFGTCNQFFNVYHPLCDGRLVEYSINVNPRFRKQANLEFGLIYNKSRKLAWIRTSNACPAVPSMGRFFYLRSYVLLRYARALWRKIGMYVLKRNVMKSLYGMYSIYEQLKELGYPDKLLGEESMKTSILFKRGEINRMLCSPRESSNLDYLLNSLAVELYIRRKEILSGARKDLL